MAVCAGPPRAPTTQGFRPGGSGMLRAYYDSSTREDTSKPEHAVASRLMFKPVEMSTDAEKKPSCLCVAIQDDKASALALTGVVDEICLWQPRGLGFTLHLVHVTLLPPDDSKDGSVIEQKVMDFMRDRFVPILNKLPESCDWDLHVLTVIQPVLGGDTNRSSLSIQAKKLIAAALCREAKKLGATELVVNRHDKAERGLSRRPLAEKVIKYSSIPVRVVGSTGKPEVHLGKGKDPGNVLGIENEGSPQQAREDIRRTTPQYPQDKTDAYSTYKRIIKGMKFLVGKGGSGDAKHGRRSSDGSTPQAA